MDGKANQLEFFVEPVLPTSFVNFIPLYRGLYKQKTEAKLLPFLVRWARLELAQDYSHYPLKVACLPFHHHRF